MKINKLGNNYIYRLSDCKVYMTMQLAHIMI